MPMRRRAGTTGRAIVATALLLAAACTGAGTNDAPAAGDDTGTAAPVDTTSPGGVASPDSATGTDAEAPAGDFAGTTEPTVRDRPPAEGVAVLDAVRTARHEGWERVVFEFRGGTLPGYELRYTAERPAQCGSGNPVQVAGGTYLVVRLRGTDAHVFDGERATVTVAERDRRPGYPLLKQLTLTCDFEAEVEWVLGLAERRPYRVLELQSPTRLVVDVQAGAPPATR